jgi:acetylornithine deacetylase/succinyl-diaminopimelate desuccinylase-like protein
MTRNLIGLVVSIVFCLLAFFVILGSPTMAQQSSAASSAITDGSPAETLRFLTDLVRIDTSNPPGNEMRAASYIKAVLDKEGIASEIFESAPGRANLVARLKGNGSKRALLLMGHLDVVGVERDKWTVDPFAAVTKDVYLYGRGSRDDKAMDAANLEVFLELHRRKIPLDRDVILLAEAGEEGTTQYGIDFMVAQHWDKIDCEYVLNEGGALHETNGTVDYASVGTTEKAPREMLLIARGSSGHASMPRLDNPIAHLGAAVGKLLAWQPPMRLNETTKEYFLRLAKISPPADAYLYTHLEEPAVQQKLAANHISQNSMLRSSIVPTIIKGGFRVNVIPAEAQATLDVRALPDENLDELMATLRKVINDPEIEIMRGNKLNDRPVAAPSSIHSEMFQALERAQAKLFPGAVTLPTMGTGATDSAQLRAKGVQAYGIGAPTSDDDALRVHGNDERIRLEGEGKFVEYLYTAVVDVAASNKK